MKRCLVCKRPNPDNAHIKSRGSGGSDDDFNIMPLCREHHRYQHSTGIVTFAKRFKPVMQYLLDNGWEIIDVNGRSRLIRKQVS